MNIAGYRLNIDALLARVVYRWRAQVLAMLAAAITLIGATTDLIPPVWRGPAALTVHHAPGATLTLDGRAWPGRIYAGAYTVAATLPDGRAAWADVTLQRGAAITLTLPVGLTPPLVRPLPPAAPGMFIAQVWPADGGWRIQSMPPTPQATARPTEPTPTPAAGQTITLGPRGAERLTTIDAYYGRADMLTIDGQLITAAYRSGEDPQRNAGEIEIRGWGAQPHTLPLALPPTLLRLAPDGATLLVGEPIAGGEQINAVTRDGTFPLVAVPGSVARVSWRDDGGALVIHSIAGERLSLTLVRLRPSVAAVAIADLDAANHAGALAPLTWGSERLLWIAPDQEGRSLLWEADLRTLTPTRRAPLDAFAIAPLAGGALRVARVAEGKIEIGRFDQGFLIGEATVDDVPVSADLGGLWRGDELLLQGGNSAWLVTIDE
jgi:hypothetical protein